MDEHLRNSGLPPLTNHCETASSSLLFAIYMCISLPHHPPLRIIHVLSQLSEQTTPPSCLSGQTTPLSCLSGHTTTTQLSIKTDNTTRLAVIRTPSCLSEQTTPPCRCLIRTKTTLNCVYNVNNVQLSVKIISCGAGELLNTSTEPQLPVVRATPTGTTSRPCRSENGWQRRQSRHGLVLSRSAGVGCGTTWPLSLT